MFRSVLLSASLLAVPMTAALAQTQTNNPGLSGGGVGSRIATAEYPGSAAADPALSPGRLARGTTGVAADENPNVAGATGSAIVPGDNSTIGTDRRATIEQRTGGCCTDGAND